MPEQNAKHITCIVDGCDFKASAPTEDELKKRATEWQR